MGLHSSSILNRSSKVSVVVLNPHSMFVLQAEELRAKKLAKRAAWDKGYAEGGAAAAAAAASAVDAGGAAAAGAGSDADVSDEDEGEHGDAQQRICSFVVPAFQ